MATEGLAFDDERAALYTVGQVAGMLGVKPAFLRRVETERLVGPTRSGGNQRRYSQREVRALERIVRLVGEGFTLMGIRRILELEAEVRDLRRQVQALRAKTR